ncbi:DUF1310 family protein [Streptococcus sp. 2022WUSS135]|uniref:DUF1310 family protein n=1 Tax=Streptococcus sp. 2022WUSS135 TaxID=2983288 RepID=UPI0015525F4D|nr:DUF1310 family protein [Streptococcus suis]HEM4280935.1 DUF1310 family protein [Streptococcus suis]
MKKVMKIIIGILLVIGIGIGYMQHKEHEKMVAIATSEEARAVYEKHMKANDPKALTADGVIKTYEIDTNSLKYNPMGGLMVDVYLNGKQNIYISYNLIDNGDGTYHSAYYIGSPDLLEFLNEEYQ